MQKRVDFCFAVYQVDKEKYRISLGMKNSYFVSDAADGQETPKIEYDNESDEDRETTATILPIIENDYMETENGKHPILAELESRASIPPLDVPLDDIETANVDNVANQDQERSSGADIEDGKNKKRAKKAKMERWCHLTPYFLQGHLPVIVFSYVVMILLHLPSLFFLFLH